MIGLAKIADRGPYVAAGLAAALLLSALWLPALIVAGGMSGLMIMASILSMMLLIMSAAVVAFVALRHGEMSALRVIGVCLVLLVVVSIALYRSPIHVPLIALVFWLPAILAAMVLARTVKLDYAVLTILACGLVVVIGMSLVVGDTTQFWRTQFGDNESIVVGEGEGGAAVEEVGSEAVKVEDGNGTAIETITKEQQAALVDTLARMMTGALGISVMSIALGALFLARSWQAGLFNPGGFQKEFHALALSRNAVIVCLLLAALSIVLEGQIADAVAMVIIFVFFVQGLAVIHALVKQRGMHRYWLHGIYVLLLLPHTVLLLAALGLADNLFGFRRTKNV